MRQKNVISRDGPDNKLIIKEYIGMGFDPMPSFDQWRHDGERDYSDHFGSQTL